MARNSEKAMTALARWRRAKEDEDGEAKKPSKRPYLATECDNLAEAEKWRGQVRFVIQRIVVKSFTIIAIHAVLGFPEPKWNPTFVFLMKGRPTKRRGHPPHKILIVFAF